MDKYRIKNALDKYDIDDKKLKIDINMGIDLSEGIDAGSIGMFYGYSNGGKTMWFGDIEKKAKEMNSIIKREKRRKKLKIILDN